MPVSEAELKDLRKKIEARLKELKKEERRTYGKYYKNFLKTQQTEYASKYKKSSKNVVNDDLYNDMKEFEKNLEKEAMEAIYEEVDDKKAKVSKDRIAIGEDLFSKKCPNRTKQYRECVGLWQKLNSMQYSNDFGKIKEFISELTGIYDEFVKAEKEDRKGLKAAEKEKAKYEEAKKDKSKLKKYIVSKIGKGSELKSKMQNCLSYGEKENKVMPLEEMKEIYGAKGLLRLICRFEDGSLGIEKNLTKYTETCNKIRQDYKSLKMESVLGALEKKVSGGLNRKEIDQKKANELKSALGNLVKYLPDEKEYNNLRTALENNEFEAKNFSEIKSLIIDLKDKLKGDKDSPIPQYIKSVVKRIKDLEGDLSLNDSGNYIEAYNGFVNGSGELAVKYLNDVGKDIVETLTKVKKRKLKNSQIVDIGKVMAMSLVAACSKKSDVRTVGKNFFDKIYGYWSN